MNIYDIAKLAGVSTATVSRVVNGSDKVSEKTRRKVLSVIEQEDYRPNALAQGLGLNASHTIGILVPDVTDVYMSMAVSFLEQYFQEKGYEIILSCSRFEQEEKENHVRMLLSRQIDGLILVGSTYAGHRLDRHETDYIREAAKQVPVFIINGMVEGENVYSAVCKDREIARKAVTELIQSGRRKILFLTDSHSYSAAEKLAGYEEALRDNGIAVDGNRRLWVKKDPYYVKNFLLQSTNLDFDAVFATEDSIAVGAVKYAHATGRSIPGDLSVIGYNNSTIAVCCEPEITSIDSRSEQLCRDTVEHMTEVLNGNRDVDSSIELPGFLVKRSTTDF